MSDSLFDDESIAFLVLINEEHQYSIWPEVLPIPRGWSRARGPISRQDCMDWLEQHWTDLRPRSLQNLDSLRNPEEAQAS